MEIHRSERRLESVRDVLGELAIITAGVLIALLLEGLAGWFHHRALAREARANITRELRDNLGELDTTLKDIPRAINEAELSTQALAAFSRTKGHSLELKSGLPMAQLSASSWTTAGATGALGYMQYAEVNRYAKAFDLQDKFSKLQDELLASLPAQIAMLQDPGAPGADLPAMRKALAENVAALRVQMSIAQALAAEYRRAIQ